MKASALLTDFYELTMAASFFARGMNQPATFDLFVRRLPPQRRFLVAAGIEEALALLEDFAFDGDDIAYLRTLGMFDDRFLAYLVDMRFSGDTWAVWEGEVVFGGEPLLSVTAPLIEAQLMETLLLNCVSYQTAVASKAARVTLACGGRAALTPSPASGGDGRGETPASIAGRSWVDFSLRRDHGGDAGLGVARAAFLAGAGATSNVLAGQRYGIPLTGTMAHSYILAFGDEAAAFRAYAEDFPGRTTLLIDTNDTVAGARIAARVAQELAMEGRAVQGVRLDSGDLAVLSREVRAILDDAGLPGLQIFVSGDLDEYRIRDLLAGGAPIDGFGVGTRLGTVADAPSLSSVYKLVEGPNGPVAKHSEGKATLPGRKQVYRQVRDGAMDGDVLALRDEPAPEGARPLLRQVIRGGERIIGAEDIAT
ncbi:hypothetical protein AYO38_10150, partial [bacterium SCGC AG-212-C10]